MMLPDDPRKRIRACLWLAAASPIVFALFSGAVLVLQPRLYAIGFPFAAVGALLYLSMIAGMAGSAYATLQLPIRLSMRVAAAVTAFFLAYVLYVLCATVVAFLLGTLTSWAGE